METKIFLPLNELRQLAIDLLYENGLSRDHAEAVAEAMAVAQRDECHSHGFHQILTAVRLLPSESE